MRIELSHAVVRNWRKSDAKTIVPHANDRAVWRNLKDRFPHPYTLSDAREWLRYMAEQNPPTNFAIEVNGEAAGGIGLQFGRDVHYRMAEIGYWLSRVHWGRGIVTEAVS